VRSRGTPRTPRRHLVPDNARADPHRLVACRLQPSVNSAAVFPRQRLKREVRLSPRREALWRKTAFSRNPPVYRGDLEAPTRMTAATPSVSKNGLRRCASASVICSTSRPRRRPRARSASITSASTIRRATLRLPERTQSSGWPVSSVKRGMTATATLMSRVHQFALAHAAHHAGRTWRGLGSDLTPIHQNDGANISLPEVKGGCRAQAAGPNDDDIGRLEHGASPRGLDVADFVFR